MTLFHRPGSFRVALVAGEASGDGLGAALMAALKQQRPHIEFVGIGGPKMQGEGLVSLYPQEALAVRGYAEVIRSLPRLLKIRSGLIDALLADRPHVFIGIDAPDFNLGLEARLKRRGVRTVHYVSPSIWAWRGERIHKIRQSVDHMLALFPMEPAIYRDAGVPVTYVGHPFADGFALDPDQPAARALLKLGEGPVFAVLPGSRVSEVDYMTPLFLETIRRLLAALPDAQFVVPMATRPTMDRFRQLVRIHGAEELPIRVLYGHAREAMVASDLVLAASGTATLEVALAKRPMVISYRISGTTYRIVKKKLRLPYVGLPNILAGRFVVPELLQHEATAANLAQAALNALADRPYQAWLAGVFRKLHLELKRNGAEVAARAVIDVATR
ncbi:MAG: lipid-A-disaccharide synthase [Laribacter sp.]|nr:lipid-A-disaccharide synthase [Laribacter sp.]MBP9608101.1 lipid-A-disaccharide synthase [Laribacter sp.]